MSTAEYEELEENQASHTPPLKKRWCMAVIIGFQVVFSRFFTILFGLMNNLYAEWFQISYVAVDWLSIIPFVGSMTANVIVAALIHKNTFGFRKLSVSAAACCVYTSFTMLIATQISSVFPLIYISQFLMGFSYASSLATTGQLAKYWFPVEERGTALSIFSLSSAMGCLLAFLLPNFIKSPTIRLVSNSSNSTSLSNFPTKWRHENKIAFAYLYGTLFIISLIMLILAIKIFKDKPITLLSNASENFESQSENAVNICKESTSFFKECKRIMMDKTFVLIAIIFCFRIGCCSVILIFWGEILRPIFSLSRFSNPNAWAGYLLITFIASLFIGNLFSARMYDYFRENIMQILVSLVFAFITNNALVIGIYYKNIIIIWIFTVALGFSLAFTAIPLYDTPVQHFSSTNPGFVLSLLLFDLFCGSILLSQFARLILIYFKGYVVLLYLSIVILVAIIICVYLKFRST